jgi:hypothetical protein
MAEVGVPHVRAGLSCLLVPKAAARSLVRGSCRTLSSTVDCGMNALLSGGCACGSIRYECAGAPVANLNCHCRDCQRSSGAPFASGVVVMTTDLQVTGTPKTYSVRGSSGGLTTRAFCAACGTPLFTRGEANPEFTSIRFPSLDDSSGFQPMVDIWTSSAASWTCLDQALPHFPQSPPAG